MNDEQLLRYSRHILLDDIGVEGQQALLDGHALVIGAGGLGSAALMYLAAAGVGRLTIVDPDVVDATNLQRQIIHHFDSMGQPKVLSAAAQIARLNPDVKVQSVACAANAEWLHAHLPQVDVVVDCSDNFATRHAVNAACVLHRVPWVFGAALRFAGQFSVFDARQLRSACYACVFPADQALEETSCAAMGIFAPLVGIIGSLQASEALRLLMGQQSPLLGRLQLLEGRSMAWTDIRLHRNPQCLVCGGGENRP
jgi:molybdopterin/thiamine biosynthesis adenylyltransferase